MQFHYHYTYYYLPLERNQDDVRGGGEEASSGDDRRYPSGANVRDPFEAEVSSPSRVNGIAPS